MLFRNLFITAAIAFGFAGQQLVAASPMGPLWHYVMAADGSSSLVSVDAQPTPAISAIPLPAEATPVVDTPVALATPEAATPSPESETPNKVVELGYDTGDFTNAMSIPQTTPTSLPVLANSAGINYSPRSAGVTLAFCTGLLYFVL